MRIPGPEEFARSSIKAFDIMREFKADPTDALHLAFACEYKTEYFATYDDETENKKFVLQAIWHTYIEA